MDDVKSFPGEFAENHRFLNACIRLFPHKISSIPAESVRFTFVFKYNSVIKVYRAM